jgi:hypothetical protein
MRQLADLSRTLNSGEVPNFNYIMPDECHDMHGAPPVASTPAIPGMSMTTGWSPSIVTPVLRRSLIRC